MFHTLQGSGRIRCALIPSIADPRRVPADLVPLHQVDLNLVAALATRDPRPRARFAERMQCVPRFVATHAKRLGLALTPEQERSLSEEALAVVCAQLVRYRGEVTLEGAAGRLVAQLLDQHAAHVCATSGLALQVSPLGGLVGALERIAPGEARILRARHFEAIPVDGLALRLGLAPELTTKAYCAGLSRLAVELAVGSNTASTRTALTQQEHEELERWTAGETPVDEARLARNPELAAALADQRRLQSALDVAGAAERSWFQVAGRDPAGPQAVAWVGEHIERLLTRVGGSSAVLPARRTKLVVLIAIVAIVALTLLRSCS